MTSSATNVARPERSVLGGLAVSIGVVAVLSLGCAAEEAPGEGEDVAEVEASETFPDAVTVDPDHYSVEFENDAVRLLRIRYAAGETSVMHHHPPNCAVYLSQQPVRMELPSGEILEEATGGTGEVACTDGEDHLPTNVGDGDLELILVEMKHGATAGTDAMPEYPDAVTADPDHYTTEHDGDAVRLVRVRYGAGETSVMHHHPAYCVIYLQDQPVTFEQPSGEVVEATVGEFGQVSCGDAEAHLPTNTGDGELEVILVEMKGRAAAEG